MKVITLAILFLYIKQMSLCQEKYLNFPSHDNWKGKRPIELSDLGTWPEIIDADISPNADYFYFMTDDSPLPKMRSIEVRSSDTFSWQIARAFSNWDNLAVNFDKSGKRYIITIGDTICIGTLGRKEIDTIVGIKRLIFSSKRNPTYLAYEAIARPKEFIVVNLKTMKRSYFNGVEKLQFDKMERHLYIASNKNDTSRLTFIELTNWNTKEIWCSGTSLLKEFAFDNTGNQAAFIVSQKRTNEMQIINYSQYLGRSIVRCREQELKTTRHRLAGNLQFSDNGRYIFFDVKKEDSSHGLVNSETANLNIWSYKDFIIQPGQVLDNNANRLYKCVIKVAVNQPYYQIENDSTYFLTNPNNIKGNLTTIRMHNDIYPWWQHNPASNTYLFDLESNKPVDAFPMPKSFSRSAFSPDGKVFVYKNNEDKHFYSVLLKTGQSKCLTDFLPNAFRDNRGIGREGINFVTILAWISDGSLLMSDFYDIWRIFPLDSRSPVKLTNSKNEQLKFRLLDDYNDSVLNETSNIYYVVSNLANKENGIYRGSLKSSYNLSMQCMGKFTIYRTVDQSTGSSGQSFSNRFAPKQSLNARGWLLMKQSTDKAPNLFITYDFKTLRQCTNFEPQKDYNWISARLLNYKTALGVNGQAVIYVPQNFDSTKKYPVVFHYYEKFTHRAYEFIKPRLMSAIIDIPWLVSNGYLVCTPDIESDVSVKTGKTRGDYVLDHILGAVGCVKSMSFVDSSKLGIAGHSFGGFETNYLVTHSSVFAAALSASGNSDLVSAYLELVPFGGSGDDDYSKMTSYESRDAQFAIGASLWEQPDLYLKQSNVLYADRIKTPILIMHNKNDEQVNFRQGVEFYMALRRLNKPSWMLQYQNEGHVLSDHKNCVDFTIRATQFFNHYLMEAAPPKWMTTGVPYQMKGIDNGLEFDSIGKCASDCKICSKHSP